MEPGERALAMHTGNAWMLRPWCENSFSVNERALAFFSPDGWTLAHAASPTEGSQATSVRLSNGEHLLLNANCPPTGPDPRCQVCEDGGLPETFVVTLGGIPDMCGAGDFNGTWTLTWVSDCLWQVYIAENKRVTFSMVGTWTVSWQIVEANGAGASFAAAGGSICHPEGAAWSPMTCYAPSSCTGFYNLFMTNGVCVLSRGDD